MSTIQYVRGDATAPIGDGHKIICHIVNDIGLWGAGFVLAVSRRWPGPEAKYREWSPLPLGDIQFCRVAPDITVANIVGQHGVGSLNGPPIRYDSVRSGLRRVSIAAIDCFIDGKIKTPSIHMPRIGCGLSGGTWDQIEPIILEEFCARGISVTVYDL